MKIVASGVKGMTNEWVAAPCLGKFVVARFRVGIVGHDGQNVWSCFSEIEYFLILAALPGAERREGAQPPITNTWLVETEIPPSRRAIL